MWSHLVSIHRAHSRTIFYGSRGLTQKDTQPCALLRNECQTCLVRTRRELPFSSGWLLTMAQAGIVLPNGSGKPPRRSVTNHCLVQQEQRHKQLDKNLVFQVPIQFEFEIEVTKSHPHFKIGPLRGIVPANGAAEVRGSTVGSLQRLHTPSFTTLLWG